MTHMQVASIYCPHVQNPAVMQNLCIFINNRPSGKNQMGMFVKTCCQEGAVPISAGEFVVAEVVGASAGMAFATPPVGLNAVVPGANRNDRHLLGRQPWDQHCCSV